MNKMETKDQKTTISFKDTLNESTIKDILRGLEISRGRKTLYIDLDGVTADFMAYLRIKASKLGLSDDDFYEKKLYREEGFYANLPLMEGAKEAIEKLDKKYYIVFLSAPSWNGTYSWSEKRIWVEKHFGKKFEKRLDLSYRKGLYMGHYLIDDNTWYGADDFIGEHIHFGKDPYKKWSDILKYLL